MDFPDTLEGFGYKFSEDGKLEDIKSGKPFNFEVKKNDNAYNQKHYEALGEVVTLHVYYLLEERCGLQKRPVPFHPSKKEPKTFIFCSKNFSEAEKLLILIHGSGVVRAGQWARSLIINDCLDSGTQIPFIERGLKEGYGILVMNTNDNTANHKTIRENENPQNHATHVWKRYVRGCAATKIALVAHSYGGVVATHLMDKFSDEFNERVFAVAMTDSVHLKCFGMKQLIKIGRNWTTSTLPLDTPIPRNFKDVPRVSAGSDKHEMTSMSSFSSIFKFFDERQAAHTAVSSPTILSKLCSKKRRKGAESHGKEKTATTGGQDVCEPMEVDDGSGQRTIDDQSLNGKGSKRLKEGKMH